MNEGKVIGFRSPAAGAEDPLTELLRTGAQQLLQQAVEAELRRGRKAKMISVTYDCILRYVNHLQSPPVPASNTNFDDEWTKIVPRNVRFCREVISIEMQH